MLPTVLSASSSSFSSLCRCFWVLLFVSSPFLALFLSLCFLGFSSRPLSSLFLSPFGFLLFFFIPLFFVIKPALLVCILLVPFLGPWFKSLASLLALFRPLSAVFRLVFVLLGPFSFLLYCYIPPLILSHLWNSVRIVLLYLSSLSAPLAFARPVFCTILASCSSRSASASYRLGLLLCLSPAHSFAVFSACLSR